MKIIITTPGNFSKKDISSLIEQGVLLIEAQNPNDVKIISDTDFAPSDSLMMAALFAVQGSASASTQESFTRALYARLKEKEVKTPQP